MADESNQERRGYRVTGRVQGVGFRWWTVRKARECGVGGHVRNLPDGGVEVQVVGPPGRLNVFERALHEGPVAARVDGVERISSDLRAPTDTFSMEQW